MIDKSVINNSLWQADEVKTKHFSIICSFLDFLNFQSSDFILKGGTSLMICYGLDRFSEDIDLDSTNKSIEKFVETFCVQNNYSYRVAKNTETTKRYMIHYSEVSKPLKIEVSYRQKEIESNRIETINGVKVYKINELFGMKINAYSNRDKIRDLYDVIFIIKNYKNEISNERIGMFKDVVSNKGLEQFDYLIKTQKDDLIDTKKLCDDFLDTFNKLGLLDDYSLNEVRDDEKDSSSGDIEI